MYSIIMTDYCSIPNTIVMIKRLHEKIKGNVHYIIVDNSNHHEGEKFLKKSLINFTKETFRNKVVYLFKLDNKDIILIDAEENGGYSRGNNIGAAYASANYSDDYYIFCNNDLEIVEKINLNLFDDLIKKNKSIGIIGVDIRGTDGERQNPRLDKGFFSQMILWDFNYLWFHCAFNRFLWNLDKKGKEGETGWVSGSFLFVNKKAFEEVKGFDEKTFLYCEEMIISEKMRRKGYITYYYPEIKIIHHHKGTQTNKSRKTAHVSKKYYYHFYKNVPLILCRISDFTFNICELGYSFWHDHLKNKIIFKKEKI